MSAGSDCRLPRDVVHCLIASHGDLVGITRRAIRRLTDAACSAHEALGLYDIGMASLDRANAINVALNRAGCTEDAIALSADADGLGVALAMATTQCAMRAVRS